MNPTELLAKLEAAKAELATAQAALTEATAKADGAATALQAEQNAHAETKKALAALQAEQETAKAKATETAAKIAELEAKDRDLEANVAKRVAALGISSNAAASTPGNKTREELTAEFNSISDPQARGEFFAKHRDALMG